MSVTQGSPLRPTPALPLHPDLPRLLSTAKSVASRWAGGQVGRGTKTALPAAPPSSVQPVPLVRAECAFWKRGGGRRVGRPWLPPPLPLRLPLLLCNSTTSKLAEASPAPHACRLVLQQQQQQLSVTMASVAPSAAAGQRFLLAVCGLHLRGQPLNHQLTSLQVWVGGQVGSQTTHLGCLLCRKEAGKFAWPSRATFLKSTVLCMQEFPAAPNHPPLQLRHTTAGSVGASECQPAPDHAADSRCRPPYPNVLCRAPLCASAAPPKSTSCMPSQTQLGAPNRAW